MINADCTSCSVQDDKSAYWTPQLYYEHSNGSFEEVPNEGTVVYYLGRGDNRTSIKPFPAGFRMLSGDMTARSYDNSTYTFGGTGGMTLVGGSCDGDGTCTGGTWNTGAVAGGPQFFGRPVSDRVSFNCLDHGEPETPGISSTSCADGLRAQLHLQSCWDGVNLYKSDNSHVAYMSQIDNGICPPTHPVQFVHLFYEVLYGVNNINKDKGGRFVFSDGDPTGYGFHGDFLNGWNMTVQTAALAECANTDNAGQITACAPLMLSQSDSAGYNCPEQPPLVAEPVHGMLNQLPGCNNVTVGPEAAAMSSMTCPAGSPQPSLNPAPTNPLGPAHTFLPVPGKTYSNWTYLGCANDSTSARALSGASTSSPKMTTETCQSFCATHGLPLAGTEYGSECYCGLSLSQGSALGQACGGMICSGNRSELCGGSNSISVWNSTTYNGTYAMFPSKAGNTLSYISGGTARKASYLGCAPDNVNNFGRALNGASYTDGAAMTIESCVRFCAGKGLAIAGTEYAGECYCGNQLGSGSTVGAGMACTMACTGNATEWCGGSSALSVCNVSL